MLSFSKTSSLSLIGYHLHLCARVMCLDDGKLHSLSILDQDQTRPDIKFVKEVRLISFNTGLRK
jgi:hypothetical protein